MTATPLSRRFILAASAAALMAPQISSAEVLEHFTFGTEPPSVLTPTTIATGVNASPITAGTGVVLDLNSNQGNPPLSSPWLRVDPVAMNTTAAAAITADARFLFTLAPLPGFTMNLTSLDFNAIKGGNSLRGYAVETTAGQLGAGPWTADIPTYRGQNLNGVVSPWTPVSIPLSDAAYQGLNSITFSIYSYSPTADATVEYDDIVVNGDLLYAGYRWTGATADWNTTAANWTGAGNVYADATPTSHVLFDDAATVTNVAVAAGGLAPANVYFGNDTKAYTLSGGAVNTPGLLHKSGTALVTINNSVTAGSAVVAEGTVAIGNGGTLTSASISVAGGATLNLGNGGSFGAGSGVIVNGTLLLDDDRVTLNTLNGGASGTVQLDDPFAVEPATILEVTGGGTFAGRVSGAGSIVKSGTDVLVLSGSNDFLGGITINAGAVQLSNVNAAGLNGTTVNENGTLLLGAAVNSGITLAGGTLGVTAAVTLPAGTTVEVTEDSTVTTYNPVTNATRNELIFQGQLTGDGDILLLAQNGNNPDGGSAFRLRGAASDYSGTITVTKAAKFEVRSDVEEGSPMGTGALVMQGGSFLPAEGGATNLNGDYSLINVRNATAAALINLGNDVRIDGPGMAVFNMLAEGGATPIGAESRFGTLTIGDGQAVAAVATGSPLLALGFDSVTLTGGNATFIPRPVGNTAFVATQNIVLGAISQGATEAGITVNGVGSVILTEANTYTGATIVQAGSLIVEGSIAASDTTVNGGILGGSGTIGEVTLAGGTINPGNGIGTLDSGNLILDSGTLAFQIGGSTAELYDQLNVTGSVSLNSQVNLTLDFAAYDPVDFTDEFVLVSNNLAEAINFASAAARLWYGGAQLDEGTIFVATSGNLTQAFSITYEGGNGNDIVLAAVPEPATALTLIGGVAMLAGMRRRRRK